MGEAADAAREVVDKGKRGARRLETSRPYQVLVRAGLVAYGVVHLIVAWMAVRLALGLRGAGEEASNTGALRSLADTPLGVVLMWAVAIGFCTLLVWQALSALIGFREFDGFKRLRRRLSAALRTLLFGYLGVAAARIAAGPEPDEGETTQESISAGLLGLPFGEWLVGAVGVGIIVFGITQVVRGVRATFNDELDGTLTGVPLRLAQAGFVGKGIAVGIVGVLFGWAALDSDARRAGGLDRALQHVLMQPYGSWLLLALALGIGAFGLFCFFWARHPKHA